MICILLLGALSGCQKNESATQLSPEPTAEPTVEPVDPYAEIETAEIKTGRHEREEGYPNPFKTHYVEIPHAAVHMEDAIFEESTLREAGKTIAEDMQTVADALGEAPEKVTVYLVQHMDRPIFLNEHVICAVDDLLSGAYREALCGACYGLSTPWKQVGLAAYIFGIPDERGLKEYYSDEAHALTASCAAMYLLEGFADEQTAEAARKTAQSMTLYLLSNGGLPAMKSVVSTAEFLPEWQAYIGINVPIVLPEGSEYAGTVTAVSDRLYRCIVRRDHTTFLLEKDSFADAPDDLYRFLCAFFSGAEMVLDKIRTELPGYTALAEERFSSPITIVLMPESVGSSGTSGPNRMDVHRGDLALHELVHALLWTDINELLHEQLTYLWQNEAIAQYFSLSAITFAFPTTEYDSFEAMAEEWFSEEFKTDPDYVTALWNVYCAAKAENAAASDAVRDDYAWQSAIGICGLLVENDPLEDRFRTFAEIYGYKPKDADGLGLTYEEAMVFMEYLFDRFGRETVVDAYMNRIPFTEALGESYSELLRDCITYLTETYGPLLADGN